MSSSSSRNKRQPAPADNPKPIIWLGSSFKDLKRFPEAVQMSVGFNLRFAQNFEQGDDVKVMTGFDANVLEIVSNNQTNTYRSVYTVEFENAIYVLHCFQKKSKRGIATPQQDIDLIESRLKAAREHSKEQIDKASRSP